MRTVAPPQTAADLAARLLTSIFAPAHLVISLLLIVGAASDPSAVRGTRGGPWPHSSSASPRTRGSCLPCGGAGSRHATSLNGPNG